MPNNNQLNKREKLANCCGVVGYSFGTLTWVWSLLFYFNFFLSLKIFETNTPATPTPPPTPTSPFNPTLSLILVALITILILGLTIYALFKIPQMIGRSSQEAIKKATKLTIPLLASLHKKKLSKKQQFKLTLGVTVALKALLFLIPLSLIFASQLLKEQPEISLELRALIGFFLAFWGLLGFLVQYSLAYLFKVEPEHLN